MSGKSKKQSRRALLLAGGAAAVLSPLSSKAQIVMPGSGDLADINLPDGLGGFSLSPPIDNISEKPTEITRAWDAVQEYVQDDTSLLAPKVPEFIPADPPMPHMKSTADLEAGGYVFEVDLERSNATKKIQIVDQPDDFLFGNAINFPDGFIVNFPAGTYQLAEANLRVRLNKGFNIGPRFIFRGLIGPDGERPILDIERGGLIVSDHKNVNVNTYCGFEVHDLEMKSPSVGRDAGPGMNLRYFRYDNVLFSEGFKNASHPGNWPTIAIYNNCAFARAGRGQGKTHTFYGSYLQSIVFRNCLFTSPKQEGHPLKVYTQNLDMRGCTVANWWHEEDLVDGYFGAQTPMDIGAWGQSFIQGCHFIRRGVVGKTRNTPFIDYRNRVYEKHVDKYRLADFGTDAAEVDYREIDNEFGTPNQADPSDPQLFRHVILDNKFFNGILPNGSIDAEIDRRPGFLIRNNGTIYNWSNGVGSLSKKDPNYRTTPTDYAERNERAIIFTRESDISGVPVRELFPGPYEHESDPSPIVDVSVGLPDWIEARVIGMNADNHWWDTEWPSSLGPQL